MKVKQCEYMKTHVAQMSFCHQVTEQFQTVPNGSWLVGKPIENTVFV